MVAASAVLALVGASCSLNPQPLPPGGGGTFGAEPGTGGGTTDQPDDAGTGHPLGNGGADSGLEPDATAAPPPALGSDGGDELGDGGPAEDASTDGGRRSDAADGGSVADGSTADGGGNDGASGDAGDASPDGAETGRD